MADLMSTLNSAPTSNTAPETGRPKRKSGTSATILDILGTIGNIAGPLVFGPEFNANLGAPFQMGAAHLRQKDAEENLRNLLLSTPQTAGLVQDVEDTIAGGGLLGQSSQPSIDYSDPTFLQNMAYYRPDLAEQVMARQASMKPDSSSDLLLQQLKLQEAAMGLEKSQLGIDKAKLDYETAQQQQAGMLTDKEKKEIDYQNSIAKIFESGDSKFLQGKEASLEPYREAQIKLDQMEELLSGIKTNPITATLARNTPTAAQEILSSFSPEFKQLNELRKRQQDFIASEIKAMSGLSATEREALRIEGTKASIGMSPEDIQADVNRNRAKLKYLEWAKIKNVYNSLKHYSGNDPEMKNVDSTRAFNLIQNKYGIDPQDLQTFLKLSKTIEKFGYKRTKESAVTGPLLKQIGINY